MSKLWQFRTATIGRFALLVALILTVSLSVPAAAGAAPSGITNKPTKENQFCVDRHGASKVVCAKTKDEAFTAAGATAQSTLSMILWSGYYRTGAQYWLLDYECFSGQGNNLFDFQDQTHSVELKACNIIVLHSEFGFTAAKCIVHGGSTDGPYMNVTYYQLQNHVRSFQFDGDYGILPFCNQ